MGDLSAEPSMEEILSSIKRIIAEEGEGPAPRGRRAARGPVAPLSPPPLIGDEMDDPAEVLELSDPITPARAEPPRIEPVRRDPVGFEPAPADRPADRATPPADPIVSAQAAAASRGALDQLSRLVVRPEAGGDGTLEGLVRDMLRPMLRDWLDAQLPAIVEEMVQREIKRITGTA